MPRMEYNKIFFFPHNRKKKNISMFARLFLWIDITLIFISVTDGYIRTYADEHYGRIRGPNQQTGIDGSIIFLIIFGCLVGGFFILCILGTLILGFFDNGFRWPYHR